MLPVGNHPNPFARKRTMVLRPAGDFAYGDEPSDIHDYLREFSRDIYAIDHSRNLVCTCSNTTFLLYTDEDQGVAVRECTACENVHPIGDSDEYLEEAEPEQNICLCEKEVFQLVIGVALYRESSDIKWLYVGARCIACGLVGCYGEWKNEYNDYLEFFTRV
jgi:hypothetical protein